MRATIFTLNSGLYRTKKESTIANTLKEVLEKAGFEVKAAGVLPEEKKVLGAVIKRLTDTDSVELILTVGSTGILENACAPEVVREMSDCLLPGIPEAIRMHSLTYTNEMILDRSCAGFCRNTLIVNLPDQMKLAKEGLEFVLPELVHAVEIRTM
jgi:molybdenum cofactor synthesis domain-containing protein